MTGDSDGVADAGDAVAVSELLLLRDGAASAGVPDGDGDGTGDGGALELELDADALRDCAPPVATPSAVVTRLVLLACGASMDVKDAPNALVVCHHR